MGSPDEEESTSPTLFSNTGDETTTAPTVHVRRGGEQQSAMAASLPAAEVSDARLEDISGTCIPELWYTVIHI